MKNSTHQHRTRAAPVLQRGFRLFFLAAMIYAVIAMSLWTLQLYFHWEGPQSVIGRPLWHAHEMVFGYTMAVIAGFLLTAVQNWTGKPTLFGHRLFVLFLFWLVCRLLALYPVSTFMPVLLAGSSLFFVLLIRSLLDPILRAGDHKQWGILGKLVLLWLLDAAFILSAHGWLDPAYARPAVLLAVYTVIGLILVMAQRVVPFFIRNAIRNRDNIRDWKAAGILSLVFFLAFVAADMLEWERVRLVSGAATVAVNAVRMWGWHDPEIWRKPLLWVLYVALLFIVAGILLRAAGPYVQVMPSLSLHAMTYGGIGVVTVGMMARVALGHTGRDVFNPPPGLSLIFMLMIAGAVVRSVLPVFWMDYYFHFILVSQMTWIGAFLLMLVYFFAPLLQARVDGREG